MIKVMTPNFRVSFPQVFEAKAMPGSDKKKFSMVCLFNIAEINKNPEQKKLWDAVVASVKQAAVEEWGDKIPAKLQNPFRKGEEKEQYQGYGPGVIFISATTTSKPGLADANLQRIISPDDFYAGCYARATINPYPWTYMGKSGISFGLQNIQKIKDGEPLGGGRTKVEDDFNAMAVAEDSGSTDLDSMFQ